MNKLEFIEQYKYGFNPEEISLIELIYNEDIAPLVAENERLKAKSVALEKTAKTLALERNEWQRKYSIEHRALELAIEYAETIIASLENNCTPTCTDMPTSAEFRQQAESKEGK